MPKERKEVKLTAADKAMLRTMGEPCVYAHQYGSTTITWERQYKSFRSCFGVTKRVMWQKLIERLLLEAWKEAKRAH